jgi:4-hydroxybenzoate polyprenyltransferase
VSVISVDRLFERGLQYYLLMRFDRPIGLLLLLWPTLWGLWIAAEGVPDGGVLTVFVLGVVLMRAAGCVINDIADRHIDPHVARTQGRPIAAGRVTVKEALGLFAVLCLLAFVLVLTMNRLTIMLAIVAVFLAATYPFVKRYTYLPQIYLGMAFGWSVPMAFAAQTGAVPVIAWLVFIATVLWATAYDTLYAMVDRDDDVRIGVKSTAILFAEADRVIIAMIQGLLLFVLWLIGQRLELGGYYYTGLMVAMALIVYQQYLIRDRVPSECFRAFLNNNWLGMAIFVGLLLEYL